MRLIALDTETTGLDPSNGHRIVEIGAVEIINGKITGHKFQTYLNPERPSDPRALEIHGLTEDFLKDKPKFKDIINDLERFINQSHLVIHNAKFDANFLSYEYKKLGIVSNIFENYLNALIEIGEDRKKYSHALAIVCTKELAAGKFLKKTSLDALVKHFNIQGFDRTKHSALIDAEILAHVYLRLIEDK